MLVEPGRLGVVNAKQRGLKCVVHSTLQDAGFASESLPSAGIFDVLEHIDSDREFLEMLHGYLRPNGHLYISVPAYRFLWSAEDVHAGHFRRYTIRTLKAVLQKTGFDIAYSSYLFSFLVPPIFLSRSIPSQLGIRRPATGDAVKKEHSKGSGLSSAIVNRCLAFELNRIQRGQSIPIGSSCIAVAMKSAQ